MSVIEGGTKNPSPHIISPWKQESCYRRNLKLTGVNGLLHGDSTRKYTNTMRIWSTSYQAGRKMDLIQSCDWSLFSSFQNRNYYGIADIRTDSFNTTVQFWSNSVLKLQVCLPIRIPMLSGNATNLWTSTKIKHKALWRYISISGGQFSSKEFFVQWNNKRFHIPCHNACEPVSTATWEITPFLLTAVKWARVVCIQVPLHVIMCLASEAK
jgi:hypothetical protein